MKWLEVVETNRSRNEALVMYCQDKPYFVTNIFVKLNKIEETMACRFSDGYHPFLRLDIKDINDYI